jgi:hypothetical protein
VGAFATCAGETQNRLLKGNEHWLIETVHLAAGVVTRVRSSSVDCLPQASRSPAGESVRVTNEAASQTAESFQLAGMSVGLAR